MTVDTRANSLQELAAAGGTAALAYSSAWATNGVPATVKITCVCDRRDKKGQSHGCTTNTLFTTAAPATGDFPYAINPAKTGFYTFHCSFLDAQGKSVEDDLTASYGFPYKPGLVLVVR